MLPRLFSIEWGGLVFHLNGYGFSIFCGTAAALLIAIRRAKQSGLPLRPLLQVFTIAVLAGFAGSKLAYALQYGRIPFPGGGVLYGGLLGGVAGTLAASRRFGLAPLAVADLGAPCALLAAAFGRLGCLFAGCCYGAEWKGGIAYPAGSHAWRQHRAAGLIGPDALSSLPTLPAPLLEAAALLVLFMAASFLQCRDGKPGRTLAACALLYAAWRFIAEFWRGDHVPYWGPLTFSQGISLAVLAAALLLQFRKLRPEPSPRREPSGRVAWGQVGAMLLVVAVMTGGVGCKAKQRYRVANEIGEAVADESCECMGACMSDCTNACIDDCSEKNCNHEQNGDRTFADPGEESPWRSLSPIETGRRYPARLTIDGTFNVQRVELVLAGEFLVKPRDASGAIPIQVQLSRLDLSFGEDRVSSGAGEAEIRVDSKGHATLRSTQISAELLGALKAVEPWSQDFLRVDSETAPDKNWSDRVVREMAYPDPRAECRGELVLGNESHPFRATAFVTRTPNGDRRVHWLLRK